MISNNDFFLFPDLIVRNKVHTIAIMPSAKATAKAKATTKAKAPLKGVKKTTATKAKKAPAKKKAVKLIKSKKAPKAKGQTISKKVGGPKKKVAKGGKKKK